MSEHFLGNKILLPIELSWQQATYCRELSRQQLKFICCLESSQQHVACCQECSGQQNFMSEHFLGNNGGTHFCSASWFSNNVVNFCTHFDYYTLICKKLVS